MTHPTSRYMLVRISTGQATTTVRFFDTEQVAMDEGRRLASVFEGYDWYVAEIKHVEHAPRNAFKMKG